MAQKNAGSNKLNNSLELLIFGVGVVALFAGLFFSAQAGIFILLAAWVAAGTWRYPKQSFLLLMFFAPLLPLIKSTQVLSLITPLKDFVIAVLLVRGVIVPIIKKNDRYRRNELLFPVLLLILLSFFATLRSDNLVIGVLRLRDILLYIPLLWVARALLVTKKDFLNLMKTFLASVGVVLVLTGVQYLFFSEGMVLRFDPVSNVWIPRASSTLAHPNILGAYLICVLPFIFVFSWYFFRQSKYAKIASFFALLGLVAIYATYSRGSWLGFSAALVALCFILLYQAKKVSMVGVASVILVVCLAVVAIPRTRTMLKTIVDPNYASNKERLEIMANLVLNTSNTSALIGNGLGDVLQSTGRQSDITIADIASADVQSVQNAKAQTFVDNAVIKTWIEVGLAGLLVVGFVLWTALKMSWRAAKNGTTSLERNFGSGFFAVTIGLVVLSVSLDVPEIFPVMLYWWTFAGVLQTLPFLDSQEKVFSGSEV